MHPSPILPILLALILSLTTACKPTSEAPEPAPDHDTETASSQPQPEPTPEPEPQNLTPAQELAQKVFEAHGGPAFPTIERIEFTFDVQADNQSVMTARHDWNLVENTDRIQWTTPDGTRLDLVFRLDTGTVDGTANDVPITDDQRAHLAPDAYRRWINDTYWLLMPLKLQDPGVILTLEEPRTIDDRTYQILHLSFENVGLTPGDQYWLYIDPDTYHIARWDMLLENQTPPPTTILWENYQPSGPLNISTVRRWPDNSRQIVLENTRIYTRD